MEGDEAETGELSMWRSIRVAKLSSKRRSVQVFERPEAGRSSLHVRRDLVLEDAVERQRDPDLPSWSPHGLAMLYS